MSERNYRLAISNLAWNHKEESDVVKLLGKFDISGIEIACSKIWDRPTKASPEQIKGYRKFWEKNGFEIVGTTSLLYGHPELIIFEDKSIRRKTLAYLKKMADVTAGLGGKFMMFGSPKNRRVGDLGKKEAMDIAVEFFGNIAKHCSQYNICFAIEPNPSIYGGDFILNMKEGLDIVEAVGHKNFGLNLDASTIASNNSDYDKAVSLALPYACHAHISEPFLKLIPNGETNHEAFAKALRTHGYKKWLSVEMPLGDGVDHLEQIEKTLNFVREVY